MEEANGKKVLEGLVEAEVSHWGIYLNGKEIGKLIKRAFGYEDEKDYKRFFLRLRIEWEPLRGELRVNDKPLEEEVA
ncbi:MAG: hypothetical protein ACPLRW_02500 [Moorellales bacterium]